ncbi:MAG: radical SAM protein [Deltaproteobacteria bacterium]|nr:radical SAM protein [Deltaproteobacteria bacterium]
MSAGGRARFTAERVLELPRARPAGGTALSYVLAYPNRYFVGMANLGFQTLLHLLSGFEESRCHRAFSDHPESLESGKPLSAYDAVALSLSFEGDYPEALRMLSAGGVPLLAAERGPSDPLVLAGGVAATLNPEPLAPFLDVVYLGEAEAGLVALHAFLAAYRTLPRSEVLDLLAERGLPGVYVPSRYRTDEEGGRLLGRAPTGRAPVTVERVWAVEPWDPARTHILASEDAFGGAYLLEVSRGCPHACRFCAAGHATRPARFLPFETLAPFVRSGAGAGRLGLVGAAVSDHPDFRRLARECLERAAGFTVSSFRAESLDEEVLGLLVRGGLKTLTIAAEGGGERLRQRLGKGISREDLLRAARLAGAAGLESLRIYGMVGLPGEEEADVSALGDLAVEARQAMGRGSVTLSVAPFVPKPHTPFQWEPMLSEADLRARIRSLERGAARHRGVRVVAEAPKWSRVQGLLSRGGREVAPLLAEASRTGDWRSVLRSALAAAVLDRERAPGERFPWDFIGGLPSREHLLREREAAGSSTRLPFPCLPGVCRACGVCS